MYKNGRYSVNGAGSYRINPVHGDDVAAFLVESVNDPGRPGCEHKVGDPDIFTFRQIVGLAADVLAGNPPDREGFAAFTMRHGYDRRAAGFVSRKSRRFFAG